MLSKLLLQDPVAFMQDINPFPRALMSIISTFLWSASPNVAGILLAPLGSALELRKQHTKVSQVHLMASSSQTSLNMVVLLQRHSRPVLLSGAKMCDSAGDHSSKPRIFYSIHYCFSCLFGGNTITADRKLLSGLGAVFYSVAPDRYRTHSKRGGPIESDLMLRSL